MSEKQMSEQENKVELWELIHKHRYYLFCGHTLDSGDARGIADIAHQFYAEIRADERKRVLEEVEKELTGMKFLFDEGYYYDCDEVRELLAKMRKA